MQAFVINLDSATDRWAFIEKNFAQSELRLERVPAIDIKLLAFPHHDFSERSYRLLHGRTHNRREFACYLSHYKALQAFLATSESHAVIGEDDIILRPDFDTVLEATLRYKQLWNIVRLSGLSAGHPFPITRLHGAYSLCVNMGRLKGAGAYLIDRRAAETLVARLLPMRLPYDHAIDREWFWGLRAACILPFPVSQTESDFLSSVQPGTHPRLSRTRRYLTTYPYQAVNEISRWLFRAYYSVSLKAASWSRSDSGDSAP
ncbi:MAG: glycosyltransferase family 25 protein [Chthoniobacterales bacterium]|nr:glycosyltransferase family 25 protein [Chthoniobacterales bacterium]